MIPDRPQLIMALVVAGIGMAVLEVGWRLAGWNREVALEGEDD